MLAYNHTSALGRSLPRPVVLLPHSSTGSRNRLAAVQVDAAKKGGGKKGAQKKGGSALADLLKKKEEASNAPAAAAAQGDGLARPDQYADPDVVLQLMMITQAYKKQYNE